MLCAGGCGGEWVAEVCYLVRMRDMLSLANRWRWADLQHSTWRALQQTSMYAVRFGRRKWFLFPTDFIEQGGSIRVVLAEPAM